jgi:hypothetical protein
VSDAPYRQEPGSAVADRDTSAEETQRRAEEAAERPHKFPLFGDGLIDPNPTRSRGFFLSRD